MWIHAFQGTCINTGCCLNSRIQEVYLTAPNRCAAIRCLNPCYYFRPLLLFLFLLKLAFWFIITALVADIFSILPDVYTPRLLHNDISYSIWFNIDNKLSTENSSVFLNLLGL